jgi:hypothetical protein
MKNDEITIQVVLTSVTTKPNLCFILPTPNTIFKEDASQIRELTSKIDVQL